MNINTIQNDLKKHQFNSQSRTILGPARLKETSELPCHRRTSAVGLREVEEDFKRSTWQTELSERAEHQNKDELGKKH